MARNNYPFAASAAGLIQQLRLVCTEEIATEHRFHPKRMWRFDVAFPALKIAAEYQGGLYMGLSTGHRTARGMRQDWEKYNTAQMAGWMVLLFGPDETRTGDAANVVCDAIRVRREEAHG